MTPNPCASSTYSSAPSARQMSAIAASPGSLPLMLLMPSMHTRRGRSFGALRSATASAPRSVARQRCSVAPLPRATELPS